MSTCNLKAPEGWRCTRDADHDGPCAAVPINGLLKSLAEAGVSSGTPKDAELIKLRWTLKTLTESVNRLRFAAFNDPERLSNITLALRHLEDAESRLDRALNI